VHHHSHGMSVQLIAAALLVLALLAVAAMHIGH
jgi:Tfp pilus assembly protein PilX